MPLEANWLARNAESELDLWAHRHPLHPAPEHLGEHGITLVPAIVAYRDAQQTGADADADSSRAAGEPPAPTCPRPLQRGSGAMA